VVERLAHDDDIVGAGSAGGVLANRLREDATIMIAETAADFIRGRMPRRRPRSGRLLTRCRFALQSEQRLTPLR
jgi:choline dehydrogenase-like flavoprotein